MDLCYDEDQQAYREAVRQFADEVLAPIARTKYDFTQALTRKEVQAIAAELERHEIGTVAPLTAAGQPDLIYLGIFIEEISRIDVAFAALANALFFQVWDLAALLRSERQKQLRDAYPGPAGRGRLAAGRAQALDVARRRCGRHRGRGA